MDPAGVLLREIPGSRDARVQPQFNAHCGDCALSSVARAVRGMAANMQIVRRRVFRQAFRVLLALSGVALLTPTVLAREVSVQEAVAQAQREASGKLLSVQTLTVGKRKVYRIKLLTRDGRVRIVQVAADQAAPMGGG